MCVMQFITSYYWCQFELHFKAKFFFFILEFQSLKKSIADRIDPSRNNCDKILDMAQSLRPLLLLLQMLLSPADTANASAEKFDHSWSPNVVWYNCWSCEGRKVKAIRHH